MKYSRYFIRKVDNSKPGITNSSAQSSHSTITTCTGTSSTTITSSLPEPHTTSYRGREKAPRPPLEPAEDNHFRDFVHRCMPQTMYGQKIRDFVFITIFFDVWSRKSNFDAGLVESDESWKTHILCYLLGFTMY